MSRAGQRRLGAAALALALVILLQRLIEAALIGVGERPLDLVWSWASAIGSSLPQSETWAVLVGLFVWLGLRSLRNRSRAPANDDRPAPEPAGTLAGWLELLDNQRRGAYFRWRVAHRASQLADELDAAPPLSQPELKSFLEAGRQLRTIRTGWAGGGLQVDPEVIAEYLERTLAERGAY